MILHVSARVDVSEWERIWMTLTCDNCRVNLFSPVIYFVTFDQNHCQAKITHTHDQITVLQKFFSKMNCVKQWTNCRQFLWHFLLLLFWLFVFLFNYYFLSASLAYRNRKITLVFCRFFPIETSITMESVSKSEKNKNRQKTGKTLYFLSIYGV